MNNRDSQLLRSPAFRITLALGLAFGIAGAAGQASARKYQDKNEHWWCEFDNANGGSINAGPFSREPDCTHVCNNYANGTNCTQATKVKRTGPTSLPKEKAPVE